MSDFGFDTTLNLDIFGGSGDDYVATNNDDQTFTFDADAQEAMRDAEMTRLAEMDVGVSSSGEEQDMTGYELASMEDETETPAPQKLFSTTAATKTDAGPPTGKGDPASNDKSKGDPTSIDKIMSVLEKNPKLLTAGLGLLGGGLAGMNQQKQFDDKMKFEQKNLDRQYDVRRQELDRAYEEKRKSLQPGTLYGSGTGRNEVWGGSGLLNQARSRP